MIANVSKDRLTTKAINKISTFRVKAIRLELVGTKLRNFLCKEQFEFHFLFSF